MPRVIRQRTVLKYLAAAQNLQRQIQLNATIDHRQVTRSYRLDVAFFLILREAGFIAYTRSNSTPRWIGPDPDYDNILDALNAFYTAQTLRPRRTKTPEADSVTKSHTSLPDLIQELITRMERVESVLKEFAA